MHIFNTIATIFKIWLGAQHLKANNDPWDTCQKRHLSYSKYGQAVFFKNLLQGPGR